MRDGLLGMVAAATALSARSRPALAVSAAEHQAVEMLQTAAALERVAAAVYTHPSVQQQVVGSGSQVLVGLVTNAAEHHGDHGRALNAALASLGGRAQTEPDEVLLEGLVSPGLARAGGLAGVVELAITLEDTLAQTHVRYASLAAERRARRLLAAIGPVEAQHAAVLRLVTSLLVGGIELSNLELPPDLSVLPAGPLTAAVVAAVSAGSFYPTTSARPVGEERGGSAGGGRPSR